MVTLLRIFLSLSRPLLFTVLDQLQNQRQLMLSPFSGHRASRLVYMPRHAPTRPLVQARRYLTHDSEVVIPSIEGDGQLSAQERHRLAVGDGPLSTCAVTRRRFSSGCKPHPATAPAGSNRSRHGATKCLKPSDSGHDIR